MNLGYDQPLYLLPFDHRHSYVTGMFHLTPPLTTGEIEAVADSKQVIYDGFRQALHDVPVAAAGSPPLYRDAGRARHPTPDRTTNWRGEYVGNAALRSECFVACGLKR